MAETTISSWLEIQSLPIHFCLYLLLVFLYLSCNDVLSSIRSDITYFTFIFHYILYLLFWPNPTYQMQENCSLFSTSFYHQSYIKAFRWSFGASLSILFLWLYSAKNYYFIQQHYTTFTPHDLHKHSHISSTIKTYHF